MTINLKMEKEELIAVLMKLQWYLVFGFAVWFGVMSNIRYEKLRDSKKFEETGEEPPVRKMNTMDRMYVAFFVCILVHGYYDSKGYPASREVFFLLSASFLHYPVATFIVDKVWPLVQALIIGGKGK